MNLLCLEIPMRLPSRANEASGQGRWHRAKLVKEQREATFIALAEEWANKPLAQRARDGIADQTPLDVLLVRIASRPLDDDNLRHSLKAIRDELATWLGCANDRDSRIRWEYGQEQRHGRKGDLQTLRIEIAERCSCPTCGRSMLGVA